MIKFLFVTSFSQKGYEQYGKRFLEGYKKYFPYECILACFYEGEKPAVDAANIWYFDLNADKEHQEFKKRHANNPEANGIKKLADGRLISDYRWQAVRFSHKIAALTSFDLPSSEWRIWLDADVIVEKPIPVEFFNGLLNDVSIVAQYIGRPPHIFHTSECGWVAYNTASEDGKQFLHDFRKCYLSDDVFHLAETHDSFVFDRIREHYEQQGCKFTDIAAGVDYPPGDFHPWPRTVLGQYLVHLKGQAKVTANQPIEIKVKPMEFGPRAKKKKTSFSAGEVPPNTEVLDIIKIANGCKNRYQQITNLIGLVKPKTIVEVGVFNGNRAIEMAGVMISQKQPVHYIGFDVFEEATPELNKKELNAKGPCSYEEVVKKLTEYQTASNGLFTFELFKGLTSDTLWNMNLGSVDFAFIDGGHSIDTIKGDYNALSDAKIIVLDDFYVAGQDVTKFGCNQLLKSIKHTLLPICDTINEMKIALALTGKNMAVKQAFTADKLPQDNAIKIKTRNCVESPVIHDNIRYSSQFAKSAKNPTNPIVPYAAPILKPTDTPYLFIGGGDSVLDKKNSQYNKNWEMIRAQHNKGTRIIAVKTSYDAIMARGIVPWGCFLLDPRPHVAESIQNPHKDTTFFIASMCDKTTWDKFAGGGFKCIGYHAGVLTGEENVVKELYKEFVMVQGGTTAGFRGVSLFYTLGIRNITLVGFDSSYEGKPDKVHGKSPKPAVQVHVHGRDFWTDPELIAQSNDMEMLSKHLQHVPIKYVGNGMLQHANSILQEMLVKQKGAREKAPFQLFPFVQALQQRSDLAEALTIDGAILYLQERKAVINEAVEKQGTLDEFLAKQVNIGPAPKD